MAKKNPKESAKIVSLPIRWQSEGAPSVFANQMIVQADENDFHLSFFEIVPPLIVGDEAEQRKQAESLGGVTARCVVRVVINADRMQKFVDAMQGSLEKHKAAREAKRSANGRDK